MKRDASPGDVQEAGSRKQWVFIVLALILIVAVGGGTALWIAASHMQLPVPNDTNVGGNQEAADSSTAGSGRHLNLTGIKVLSSSATPRPVNANGYPYASPVPGKPGFFISPYAPDSGYVDLRGFASGTEVRDPYSGKMFVVP